MPSGKHTKISYVQTLLEGEIEMRNIRKAAKWQQKTGERWKNLNEASNHVLDTWLRMNKIKLTFSKPDGSYIADWDN